MTFWLTVFEQFAPWLVMLWFARKTALQMRFLERQLEQLNDATARVLARDANPKDVQALAANATPPPELEPEQQPLPVAVARYRDE